MATPTKGSLEPKVTLPLEDLQAALNPAAPTVMQNVEFTGGVPTSAVAEAYAVEQAAPLVKAEQAAAETFGTAVQAAVDNSLTNRLMEQVRSNYDEQFRDYDPNFDRASSAVELAQRFNLPTTDDNLSALGRAGTLDAQIELAERMQELRRNEDILERHGAVAITAGVLDPTQLLIDGATLGFSRALRLGRAGAAMAGVTVGTGTTALGESLGVQTDATDYLISASLTGGAMALFGATGAKAVREGGRLGTVPIKGVNSAAGFFNKHLSEVDKLAATPAARDLLRNLVDDPVRREGWYSNGNAASFLRRYANEADGLVKEYDDLLEQGVTERTGMGWFTRRTDINGDFTNARDTVNKQVADELLRRDAEWFRFGSVRPNPEADALVTRLADQSDKLHARLGELARDAGVRGFEDFTARPGYFHRSWNPSEFRRIENATPGTVRNMLKQSALRGINGIDEDEADAIAASLIQRAKDKASGARSEFMGALGKADTAFLRESLEAAKVSEGRIASIMAKVEQKASDQGTIKYGKHRLSLDMSVTAMGADGVVYKMTDLIDTDLDRVIQNYSSSISGRSALAKAGVGSDDSELEAFRRSYEKSLGDISDVELEDQLFQFDSLMADFTGNVPDRGKLGQWTQRAKSIADATMLSGSGMWQAAEYSTIAYQHGVVKTGAEFVKAMPGVRQALERINGSPDLADELATVLNLDLARDVRIRPWKRQHDAFLESSDTVVDRLLHNGKQAVPFLNGMKFIHAHQARMNANLVLNKFARAAKGDTEALEAIKRYAPDLNWDQMGAMIRSKVTYRSDNATSMNWGEWLNRDIDQVMNIALRMMDDAVLYGRVGQGASFSRSSVGQVMGQFRSFVSLAHNKLLRGTLNSRGPQGMATLLAFQYPLTFLMVSANEARKGTLDLSEDGIRQAALKTLGYTAGLGFVGDAAGILGLTGGRGGFSTPITAVADVPGRVLNGGKAIFEGDVGAGAAELGKAASMVVPYLNVMPGTALALDAMKGD